MKKIGIAGATGLVGETLIRAIESSPHKIDELRLFASSRSAGKKINFRGNLLEIRELDPKEFTGLDLAFFCLEPELAKRFVPEAARFCPVIDKSSYFRLKKNIPLIVPEVNPEALKGHKHIIANPNCTTIPFVVAIAPLHRKFVLDAVWVATYQSVSGAGRDALEQFQYETEFLAMGQKPDIKASPFGHQVVDNLIPQIGPFDSDGNSAEELKLVHESKKILNLPELKLNVTCVRVPVTIGHSLAVACRFKKPVKPKQAEELLKKAKGVHLTKGDSFITPAQCRNNKAVFVSRIRQGAAPDELLLWIVTDNLYKGAAFNALQIAEIISKEEK
ncbi:aspartate-semialdehyde dehydrogenase [candidate division WOR-3 bacterium JGI_Cruoil_03_51_56]|uniref:Aspartate-semialdehyde dehydrogenase n=1 Tax=candidate division WOR-3 bacterium JGI_Cruoil_03_51_56 TaxID=1973747 RepID=A0A235BXM2_UNCW3|nr:MAG: aspartate-semialdehyde dehydrogenase [candidate division WOR-3 bacterium JGI_Cruoil_03_51_56]